MSPCRPFLQGFLSGDTGTANLYFDRAADCFKQSVQQEPNNDSYRRALEMSSKAPQLYVELQRQLAAATQAGGSPRAEARATSTSQQHKGGAAGISDFWYDMGGWVMLGVLAFGLVALSRGGQAAA